MTPRYDILQFTHTAHVYVHIPHDCSQQLVPCAELTEMIL
jgi:hypothetical protein